MPENELVRPGFIYVPNFLTEAESKNLELNASRFGRWIPLKNRRVQKGQLNFLLFYLNPYAVRILAIKFFSWRNCNRRWKTNVINRTA